MARTRVTSAENDPIEKYHYLVYTTMTSGTDYVEYDTSGQIPRIVKRVRINGGAGLAHKRTLVTPLGVSTKVSGSDMVFLMNNQEFMKAVDAGFIKYIKDSGWNSDPDAVAADMAQRDGSAPYVPADYEARNKKAPLVGKPVAHSTRGNNRRFAMDNRIINQSL